VEGIPAMARPGGMGAAGNRAGQARGVMTASPYLRVTETIRAQIEDGALRPGTALPIRRLMREHKVSRHVVDKVLTAL
jgi:DNA-binding GntR family transcriptional regulator